MTDKYAELRAVVKQQCNAILIEDVDGIRALLAERDALREALADLVQGYVNTLESGRDRIVELGGQCDPVDAMEASDPYLLAARAALTQEQGGE